MTSRELQLSDTGTPLEVLPPILFNTYKHHASALRCRIDAVTQVGEPALRQLVQGIDVLGTRLMDLYTGEQTPRELSAWIIRDLQHRACFEEAPFQTLLGEQGYAMLTHPQDGSQWVLRKGEGLLYVHLHPGRWSPQSIRVKATVLKTAVVTLAHCGVHGGNPLDRLTINKARATHLGLPPLGQDPDEALGLGAVLKILFEPMNNRTVQP